MASRKYPTTRPSLSEVKEQFKIWRRTRKSPRPIPEQLWQAAVSLTATHSISQISKELVLDYTALKNRVPTKKKSRGPKQTHTDNMVGRLRRGKRKFHRGSQSIFWLSLRIVLSEGRLILKP